MNTNPKSKSYSRRSAGVLLLVGVLAGVTVGGGVGVIAASSTKTVTVCANKKTNVLRYAKNGKCAKTETKVVLNQTGATGTKGDSGTNGTNGTNGADGTAGTNGAAGASSPTGFTARSVCGSNGTTLCAVGVQGPGGGTIVYVDSTNEMPMYDYLEVAPADASAGVVWSTTTAKCGTAAGTSCQTSYLSDAGTALGYIGLGTGRAATAAIVARHDAGAVAKASYAAGVADAYTTATASDWFLPSKDELNEVCKYARNTGQAAGASTVCTGGTFRTGVGSFASDFYWGSSEDGANYAYPQSFLPGTTYSNAQKAETSYVRPVRAF
jgi:hypothetical protein